MPTRRLTVMPLQVQPALVGSPLASPAFRLAALAVDAALLVAPTIACALAARA